MRTLGVCAFVALLLLAMSPPVVAAEGDATVRITLHGGDGPSPRFEVEGLTAEQRARLKGGPPAGGWAEVFAVSVGTADDAARQPMLGEHSVMGGRLRFVPRFPLRPGLTYTARLRTGRIDGSRAADITRTFRLDPPAEKPPANVEAVYPTREAVPENLLKFYIHFSAPMSQGDSYRFLHLMRADGTEVELPFLELGEELWDDTGTRLTVFFDPGRIKRGLKPREEAGPVLEEGKRYTLVIDRAWPDAAGRPLKEGLRKPLHAGPPDERQPATPRWKIIPPASGTRGPLVVEFDEPLDHAMLQRVLSIHDAADHPVTGTIAIDRAETRWQFRPSQPWQPGHYRLVVATTLEDLAGNSLGRPFEVDVFHPIRQRAKDETTAVPFDIADSPRDERP